VLHSASSWVRNAKEQNAYQQQAQEHSEYELFVHMQTILETTMQNKEVKLRHK
jgi:hypothetical protein